MHERELEAELGRFLDGFGPYDRRHTAALFGQLPARGASTPAMLALAGAGLVAAIVVTAVLVPRLLAAPRTIGPAAAPAPHGSASPPPTAPPRPAALVLGVPAAGPAVNRVTPVTWVRVDWSGHRLGAVSPPPGLSLDNPSPDGSLAVTAASGGGMTLLDAAGGHVVGTVAPGITGVIWADDSRHLCGLASASGGQQLVVVTVDPSRGETGRRSFPTHVTGSDTTFVSACSAESDRAVLTNFWVVGRTQAAGDVEVLRLSTGATLLHRAFPAPAPFINVFVSRDGLFMVGSLLDDPHSAVVDLLSGQVVAHLNGVAEAFTADDRYVAVSSFVTESSRPGGTGSLVEWRTGRTVWQDHGQVAILGVEPDGNAIAVQLYGSDQEPPDHDRWLIVRPDGSAIVIRQNGSGP
jgi:hypothetical protein